MDDGNMTMTSSGIEETLVFPRPSKMKSLKRSISKTLKTLKRSDSNTSITSLFSLDNFPIRKRKRKTDEDTMSCQSLDLTTKKSKRKRRTLSKISSVANILSPIKPIKNAAQSLQRSFSFKMPSPAPKQSHTPYRKPQPAKSVRRPSKLFSDSVDGSLANLLRESGQIKRQEAIHELYQGEVELVEDLSMVKKIYYDPMKLLNLITEEESKKIFGIIEELVPLHKDLVQKINQSRNELGAVENIGKIINDWSPCLKSYTQYCANQSFAKSLLDEKKENPKVRDFLQRCQESPFSRKLDLWSFLDVPRSKLVKYPLLLKNIIKKTSEHNNDIIDIQSAITRIEAIINNVDQETGRVKCDFTLSRLDFLDESTESCLDYCTTLLCEGILRNSRGTKLNTFLFDKCLVLTRPATRNNRFCYQVYRQPIPVCHLIVEDLKDGEVKMGSFRASIIQNKDGKNMFKVSSDNPGQGASHTLQASSEHDKRQWLQCLRSAIPKKQKQSATGSSTNIPKAREANHCKKPTEEQEVSLQFHDSQLETFV